MRKISLWSVEYSLNQSTANFGRISNSIEISLVVRAPGQCLYPSGWWTGVLDISNWSLFIVCANYVPDVFSGSAIYWSVHNIDWPLSVKFVPSPYVYTTNATVYQLVRYIKEMPLWRHWLRHSCPGTTCTSQIGKSRSDPVSGNR